MGSSGFSWCAASEQGAHQDTEIEACDVDQIANGLLMLPRPTFPSLMPNTLSEWRMVFSRSRNLRFGVHHALKTNAFNLVDDLHGAWIDAGQDADAIRAEISELVAAMPENPLADFMVGRGYIGRDVPLLKYVAVLPGQEVRGLPHRPPRHG